VNQRIGALYSHFKISQMCLPARMLAPVTMEMTVGVGKLKKIAYKETC